MPSESHQKLIFKQSSDCHHSFWYHFVRTFLTRKLMDLRLKRFSYLNVRLWQIVKNETPVILWFTILFFSHSRWDSGLVYWHQHNQSLWNHLLVTTLRNKKRRLDNGSWFFLVYSSSTCFIYLWYLDQGAYEILHSEKNHQNFNVLFFSLREINVIFHSMVHTYVLILN